ncbi:hypothetical protein CBA19CS11_32720 [Caballeronia novacaledonica]|nr:TetR family transcriptional regulator [Caballeronia novacaledonica]GJH13704.1 hypothetical protein CBA19CS11_32720 [Caballeronia novacaledonica]
MSEASAPLVKRDPEGTRRRILAAATEQFTSHGLAGARVDAIARAADTNERMLYYYYGSKEGLYVAVLEEMYADYASREAGLDLADLTPTAAITLLAQTIWTYVRENPGWLCLINNENLHQGRYVKGSGKVKQTISPVVENAPRDPRTRGRHRRIQATRRCAEFLRNVSRHELLRRF